MSDIVKELMTAVKKEQYSKYQVIKSIFAFIGLFVVIGAAVYGIYSFLRPIYFEDYDDVTEDYSDDEE